MEVQGSVITEIGLTSVAVSEASTHGEPFVYLALNIRTERVTLVVVPVGITVIIKVTSGDEVAGLTIG